MEENILSRHTQEWEEYHKARAIAKAQLDADEWLIRTNFGITPEAIPKIWHDKIKRDFDTWQEQWGNAGWRLRLLFEKQWHEISAMKNGSGIDMIRPQGKKQSAVTSKALTGRPYFVYSTKTAANPIRYVFVSETDVTIDPDKC